MRRIERADSSWSRLGRLPFTPDARRSPDQHGGDRKLRRRVRERREPMGRRPPTRRHQPSRPPSRIAPPRSASAFRHGNGARGRYLLPEIMGSGAALFDADGDGDLDAYLVQGAEFESGTGDGGSPARDRLFLQRAGRDR